MDIIENAVQALENEVIHIEGCEDTANYCKNISKNKVIRTCKFMRLLFGDTIKQTAEKLNVDVGRLYRFEQAKNNDLELFVAYMILYMPYDNIRTIRREYDCINKMYVERCLK